jgi:hypothetical protein
MYSEQMFAYGCVVEKSYTISLCNLNTTYHFLGRRQTARYVNYSKSHFKSTPFILSVTNWLTI